MFVYNMARKDQRESPLAGPHLVHAQLSRTLLGDVRATYCAILRDEVLTARQASPAVAIFSFTPIENCGAGHLHTRSKDTVSIRAP